MSFAKLLRVVFLFAPLAACGGGNDGLPSSGSEMARLGQLMADKGEIGASIDFYRRALASEPKNAAAARGLATALEAWGDKAGAAQACKDGLAFHPSDTELRRLYGRLLLTMDDPKGAKEQYEAALDQDDDDIKARGGLGVALDHLGEHKKAQAQYEKVLKDRPRHLATLNNLGYSYILSRRYDLAIKTLEPALNEPKATAALRQNLALAYGLAGMEADARRVAAMDLSPDKVAANMDYYRRQRAEMAVTTTPYAEVGTYATEGMAVAQAQKLRERYGSGGGLKPVVLPQVASPGGTPRFAVRMMGCAKPSDVSRLCQTLSAAGLPCVAKGKGME